MVRISDGKRSTASRKKEISWQAVYYHWQKWNRAGCFEKIWHQSVKLVKDELDCSYLNLDGSHTIAKKGGESVAYQYRKRAKTSINQPLLTVEHHQGYSMSPPCWFRR